MNIYATIYGPLVNINRAAEDIILLVVRQMQNHPKQITKELEEILAKVANISTNVKTIATVAKGE